MLAMSVALLLSQASAVERLEDARSRLLVVRSAGAELQVWQGRLLLSRPEEVEAVMSEVPTAASLYRGVRGAGRVASVVGVCAGILGGLGTGVFVTSGLVGPSENGVTRVLGLAAVMTAGIMLVVWTLLEVVVSRGLLDAVDAFNAGVWEGALSQARVVSGP